MMKTSHFHESMGSERSTRHRQGNGGVAKQGLNYHLITRNIRISRGSVGASQGGANLTLEHETVMGNYLERDSWHPIRCLSLFFLPPFV